MRQLVICSFTLLIVLPAIGRCQDAEQVCPYAGKCRLQVRICCQKAEKCGQDAKKCCAEATACPDKATACECEAAACQTESSACPCKAAARVAQAKACQAKTTACETKAAACQAKAATCQCAAKACRAKTNACQVAVTACQAEATACACKPECYCNNSQVADADQTTTRLLHLYKAAGHLQAAGLKTEAEHVMAEVHALCEELLVAKVAELVQVEVEQAASQHEKILIRISSVPSDASDQIDLHLPHEATRKLFVCEPSQATVYSVQAANGEHPCRVSVEKILARPDDACDEEEVADAPQAPPAPTAQAPAATRK